MSLWVHATSPTCAVQGSVVHAADPFPLPRGQNLKSKRTTIPTVCGKQRAKRIGVSTCDSDGRPTGAITVVWPPYVAEMAEQGYIRCPECMKLRPGKPNKMIPDELRYDAKAAI